VQLALAAVLSAGGDPATLHQTLLADDAGHEFAITLGTDS